MLTQESAYKQIQDAKTMVEDDLQHKLDEFEEERERLIKLANTASTLERELEQVLTPNLTVTYFPPGVVCEIFTRLFSKLSCHTVCLFVFFSFR